MSRAETLRDDYGETNTAAGVNDSEIYAVCEDGTRVQGAFIIGSGTASGDHAL